MRVGRLRCGDRGVAGDGDVARIANMALPWVTNTGCKVKIPCASSNKTWRGRALLGMGQHFRQCTAENPV